MDNCHRDGRVGGPDASPAPARGALPHPLVRPPAIYFASPSTLPPLPDPRLMLRGMVGGESSSLARVHAGSAIVHGVRKVRCYVPRRT
eukprot:5775997-Pleurochrysis_carterae.AAC.2